MNKELHKELEDLGSSLIKTDNKGLFDPPEDYYEKMQKNVFAQLGQEDHKPKVRIFTPLRIAGIAASILVIAGALFLIQNRATDQAEIAQVEAYQYLNSNIDELDESVILEFIDAEEIVLGDESMPDQKAIENYFEENPENLDDIDIEQLF